MTRESLEKSVAIVPPPPIRDYFHFGAYPTENDTDRPDGWTMDELLSLFDCDDNSNIVPHEEEETYNNNDRDHQSSFTTFVDAASSSIQQSSSVRNHSSQQQQQRQRQNDTLTGLRIVDRRTSHATLLDIYSNYIYAPCSIVAAASRNEWNTNYLLSSANNEGGGKTQLATSGILTSDVYSQISPKSGKAFAILSLGSLTPSLPSSSSTIGIGGDNTVRPSITVFLFGNALSVLHADTIKYMKVGYVISVLGPNLLPPRQQQQGGGCSSSGSSTSVTLSICDAKQILHIGKAADCDRCKGTARKRVTNTTGTNMNNRWEDVRCSTLVDTRQFGGYCTVHRRQGLSSSSSSSSQTTISSHRGIVKIRTA
jgi:hypothetical protein